MRALYIYINPGITRPCMSFHPGKPDRLRDNPTVSGRVNPMDCRHFRVIEITYLLISGDPGYPDRHYCMLTRHAIYRTVPWKFLIVTGVSPSKSSAWVNPTKIVGLTPALDSRNIQYTRRVNPGARRVYACMGIPGDGGVYAVRGIPQFWRVLECRGNPPAGQIDIQFFCIGVSRAVD